ncbi:hypothetical protein WJX82_008571 [Trebouxia sp. C0006]
MTEPHQNSPSKCAIKRRAQLDRLKRTTRTTESDSDNLARSSSNRRISCMITNFRQAPPRSKQDRQRLHTARSSLAVLPDGAQATPREFRQRDSQIGHAKDCATSAAEATSAEAATVEADVLTEWTQSLRAREVLPSAVQTSTRKPYLHAGAPDEYQDHPVNCMVVPCLQAGSEMATWYPAMGSCQGDASTISYVPGSKVSGVSSYADADRLNLSDQQSSIFGSPQAVTSDLLSPTPLDSSDAVSLELGCQTALGSHRQTRSQSGLQVPPGIHAAVSSGSCLQTALSNDEPCSASSASSAASLCLADAETFTQVPLLSELSNALPTVVLEKGPEPLDSTSQAFISRAYEGEATASGKARVSDYVQSSSPQLGDGDPQQTQVLDVQQRHPDLTAEALFEGMNHVADDSPLALAVVKHIPATMRSCEHASQTHASSNLAQQKDNSSGDSVTHRQLGAVHAAMLELMDACVVRESLKELIAADAQRFDYSADELLCSMCSSIRPVSCSSRSLRLQARAEYLDSSAATINTEKYSMGADKYTTIKNPTATLSNGQKIPLFGLGTWRGEAGQVENAIEMALRAGYRHIDCAAAYGNEDAVGEAFSSIFKEGKVTRKDVWITSKLNNPDHGRVREACQQTIKDLKAEYLDLYLMHWPLTGNKGKTVEPPIKDTWQEMEKLVDDGLVKSIGISNFSCKKIDTLLSYARIKPVAVQVEVHPYFRNQKLVDHCKAKNIHVTAYSPMGTPPSSAMFKDYQPPLVMNDPVVKELAEKYKKNVGQICIKWGLQHGTSVIPKATSEDHVVGNADVFDWEISSEDFEKLSTLKHQMRMLDGRIWDFSPEKPYHDISDFWDGEVPESNLELERKQIGM